MEHKIFEYFNYKKFIIDKIKSLPSKGRGIKNKIAQELNIQSSYLSQVLNGEIHLTLEQGIKLNQFFELNTDEQKYFISMLSYARATSEELKKFYLVELKDLALKNADLKKRTKIKDTLSLKDQDIYYSSWIFAAIHILITINGFKSINSIARRLKIPRDETVKAINFLIATGLIDEINNEFVAGVTRIHLEKTSAHIKKHHLNWRLKAISSLEFLIDEDLHFSNVISISEKDISIIREIFTKAIVDAREIIKTSKEEKLYSICLDFFEVN